MRNSRDAAVRADAIGGAGAVTADLEQAAQSLHQVLTLVAAEDAVRATNPDACSVYPREIIENLRIDGVIVASVDLAGLSDRLRRLLRFSTTSLTVIDGNGVVLVRRPGHDAWVGHTLPPERLARLMNEGEGTRAIEGLDGRPRIVGVAQPGGVLIGILVIVGRDREDAFTDIDAATERGVTLITIGALPAVVAGRRPDRAHRDGRSIRMRPARRSLRRHGRRPPGTRGGAVGGGRSSRRRCCTS